VNTQKTAEMPLTMRQSLCEKQIVLVKSSQKVLARDAKAAEINQKAFSNRRPRLAMSMCVHIPEKCSPECKS
jgi:hypothetical protein